MSHKVKDPGRVHFTHHVCEVAGHNGASWTGSYDHATGVHTRSAFEAAGYNMHGRTPEYRGCSNARRKGEGIPKFTTNAGEVTCKLCRATNAENTARAWKKKLAETSEINHSYYKSWRSDEELTIRCWWACCRHHGVASPFETPAEERRYVLERRAEQFLRATTTMAFVGPGDREFTSMLPDLQERIAKLEPEDQPHMTRYLAEAKRVDKLLAEAHKGMSKLHDLRYAAALLVQYGKGAKQGRAA